MNANIIKMENSNNFESINNGYNSVFKAGKTTIGLVVPIECYDSGPVPTMQRHIERVMLAEKLGFKALWLRDVPFNVPSFGDAGQTYDPFVYLGFIAAHTKQIALGVASIILPLRSPAHIAKSAASVDVLSNGRVIMGIATGDRPDEYPAFNIPYDLRGERFRECYVYIRNMTSDYQSFENSFGKLNGSMDMLPKPVAGKVPLMITGGSQQSAEWIVQHGDGRMLYPADIRTQAKIITEWRKKLSENGVSPKPVMEPLYLDLTDDPDSRPQQIHLGLRLGHNYLIDYLKSRESIGVNHIAINLRFNKANIEKTLEHLAENVLPEFEE